MRFLQATLFALILMSTISAQKPGEYEKLFSEDELRDTLKFLSDDGFQGRAPGSPGGELAAKYLALRLKAAGVKPGNNGSYFQPVPLIGLSPNPNTKLELIRNNNGKTTSLDFGSDFVALTDAQKEDTSVEGELVFVGYGVDAPEQNWNDYKGNPEDFRGKILVVLVNDPPATKNEPDLFGGRALTYYGRWSYKYEEAARKGAKGVILVHTDESAGYGWNVVENSFGGTERFSIVRKANDDTPFLQMQSWIRAEALNSFLNQNGFELGDLIDKAAKRDFEPIKLGGQAKIDLKSKLRRVDSRNVVGVIEGRDPELKDQTVVYTGHWDHLGVGKPDENGDTIYNGARDNASGISQILALADAFAKLKPEKMPRRTQVFLFTTAEEQGLLGSEYYARNPIYPIEKTAANINIDGGNLFGKTSDFGALGAERSNLGDFVNQALNERGMTFTPDGHPEQGYFFRSDHFPFAKAGVPALSIATGGNFIGKPAGFAAKINDAYSKNDYHQQSDEFRESWVYDGMTQMLDIVMDIGLQVSNADEMPKYNPKDEFAGVRKTKP